MTEQFANNASSTLNGAILSTDTSLIIQSADTSKFPTSGNFRLLIGTNPSTAEIVLVTGVSGATFTIVRGQENTTAIGWPSLTTVTHILTAGSIGQIRFSAGGDLTGTGSSQQVISITGATGTVNISSTGASIVWAATTSSPTLKQADQTGGSVNGQLLTIQAQNATGTTSTGGDAILQSGTGTTAAGNVKFNVGSNLAGYFDSNRTFRSGLNPSSNISVLGGTNNEPGNGVFCYNAGGFSTVTNASGTASTEAIVSIFNTAAGGSLTTGLRLVGAGSANGNADWVSNGVIEQVGESASALVFSSLTGAGASRTTTGRIYRSGAWTVGSASNNNTSSGAQAGLTGPLINISSASGTATTTTNQALLYNVSGSARLQGNTETRFEVGTTLAGYFDSNKTFRIGPNASSTVSAYTSGVYPLSTDSLFLNNTAGNAAFRIASGNTGNSSVIDVMNVAGGATATVSIRLFAAGTTQATTGFAGNGIVEQVGASTSAMVFSKVLGDGTGRATTGRIYQSGAWGVGDASNNNTSSGAQAGLTGALLNLSAITGGTLTSTANQALVYNSAGTAILQGNVGHSFIASTTTVASTSTSKFITNVGRRIATNVKTASYLITTSDEVILVGSLATSITITLPASPTAGDTYTIKDQGGTAATFNIIVSGNGVNIDGASTYTMNLSYESITLIFGNGTWSII